MVAADAGADLGDMNQPASAPVEIVEPSLEGAGPMEFEEAFALEVALAKRLDLRTSADRVEDAQRKVVVAANALLPEATLGGSAQAGERRGLGSADAGDAEFSLSDGSYEGFLNIDLAMERTAERNAYRRSLLLLEQAVRDYQALEDQVKVEIRSGLRDLLESRENLTIQAQAVELATRRVRSTDLFLQAGRAEIRDVLEAQNDLLSAQNALTSALVSYRLAELGIQRDMGVLGISDQGLWEEFEPALPDEGQKDDHETILE
jgi:outer membrane protein TolC